MVSVATTPPDRSLSRDVIRLLWEMFRIDPWPFLALTAVTIIGNLRTGAYVAALGGLTQAFIDQSRPDAIRWVIIFLGADLLEQLYWPFRNHLQSVVADASTLKIQKRVLARAADVPLEAFEDGPFFARLQRANDDLGRHIAGILEAVQNAAQVIIMLGAIMIPLWLIHPGIVGALLLGSIPAILLEARYASVIHDVMERNATTDRLSNRLQQLMLDRDAAAEVRLFGSGSLLWKRWTSARTTIASDVLGAERTRLRAAFGGEAGIMIGIVVAIVIVVRLLLDAEVPLGSWVSVIMGIEWGLGIATSLAIVDRMVREESAYLGDLFAFEDHADALLARHGSRPDPRTIAAARGMNEPMGIVAERVSFSYPSSERTVIDNVSLAIHPGEHIALVGENGAGKSTLVRLLTGLYVPTSGAIELDGLNTRADAALSARHHIGAVFQDYVRWELPLRDSVSFGDTEHRNNDMAIRSALEKSDLNDLESTLDDGLDSWLGRQFGNRDLSGGQWQRLALARAFYRDSRLLVLDEPTAALDPLAEQRLFERFRDLAAGRTALTVSHRLGPARTADRIIVMHAGRIVETGSHDELMASNGRYASMFRAQSTWYTPKTDSTEGT